MTEYVVGDQIFLEFRFFYTGVFVRSIPRAYNVPDRILRVRACLDNRTQNSECNKLDHRDFNHCFPVAIQRYAIALCYCISHTQLRGFYRPPQIIMG